MYRPTVKKMYMPRQSVPKMCMPHQTVHKMYILRQTVLKMYMPARQSLKCTCIGWKWLKAKHLPVLACNDVHVLYANQRTEDIHNTPTSCKCVTLHGYYNHHRGNYACTQVSAPNPRTLCSQYTTGDCTQQPTVTIATCSEQIMPVVLHSACCLFFMQTVCVRYRDWLASSDVDDAHHWVITVAAEQTFCLIISLLGGSQDSYLHVPHCYIIRVQYGIMDSV